MSPGSHSPPGATSPGAQEQTMTLHGHPGYRYACGPRARPHEEHDDVTFDHDGGGAFGVRRPLRFMAHKLDLNEAQIAELATILDDLKTERAQAAVDHRRSVAVFADALAGASFDAASARTGAELRVKAAERLRDAVLKALQKTHAMLDDEQRRQLAYLLRSGALTI